MSGWSVGDLAVNIVPSSTLLVYRGVYRVEAVTAAARWREGQYGVGLVLVGERQPENELGDFYCGHFRKVLPADPAFAEQMRSLKPRVDA